MGEKLLWFEDFSIVLCLSISSRCFFPQIVFVSLDSLTDSRFIATIQETLCVLRNCPIKSKDCFRILSSFSYAKSLSSSLVGVVSIFFQMNGLLSPLFLISIFAGTLSISLYLLISFLIIRRREYYFAGSFFRIFLFSTVNVSFFFPSSLILFPEYSALHLLFFHLSFSVYYMFILSSLLFLSFLYIFFPNCPNHQLHSLALCCRSIAPFCPRRCRPIRHSSS